MRRALALVLVACGATAADRLSPAPGDPRAPADAGNLEAGAERPLVDAEAVDAAPPLRARIGAELELPIDEAGRGLTFDVSGAGDHCFQVDRLTKGSRILIDGPEPGIFCQTCSERAQVAHGGARFVFPSTSEDLAHGPANVTIGLRDCVTLTPIAPPAEGLTLDVRARALGTPPRRGVVKVDVLVTASSIHAGTTLPWLAPALDEVFASAGLHTLVTVRSTSGKGDARFSTGDSRALVSVLGDAPTSGDVRVILAGCLELRDDVTGLVREVQGYTPHVPGGAGPADAVFIQGTLCGTPQPIPVNWSDASLARVIAHEMGHYLGLYHPVEDDGTLDPLSDTDEHNQMARRPTDATARGFTPMQGAVMRRHPSVVPE